MMGVEIGWMVVTAGQLVSYGFSVCVTKSRGDVAMVCYVLAGWDFVTEVFVLAVDVALYFSVASGSFVGVVSNLVLSLCHLCN